MSKSVGRACPVDQAVAETQELGTKRSIVSDAVHGDLHPRQERGIGRGAERDALPEFFSKGGGQAVYLGQGQRIGRNELTTDPALRFEPDVSESFADLLEKSEPFLAREQDQEVSQ